MTTKTIITLGRQFGSGGRVVIQLLPSEDNLVRVDMKSVKNLRSLTVFRAMTRNYWQEQQKRAVFVKKFLKITMRNQQAASYIPL